MEAITTALATGLLAAYGGLFYMYMAKPDVYRRSAQTLQVIAVFVVGVLISYAAGVSAAMATAGEAIRGSEQWKIIRGPMSDLLPPIWLGIGVLGLYFFIVVTIDQFEQADKRDAARNPTDREGRRRRRRRRG